MQNQECLASYKKKLIACARVRCKRRVDSVAASPREYLVRRAAKNVISPPQKKNKTPPKKQQCKNQECLASYKKKLIACARVRCKRRVDSVAASPREYLVRRAAKNVISPPQKKNKTPPKKQQCKNQECLASYKKKLIACARVRCKRRVDSVAASPREYLVRRAAKNVISPPKTPQNPPKPTAVYKPWSNYPVPSDRHPRCKEFWRTASWICLGQKDDLSHRRTNIGPTFSHTIPAPKKIQVAEHQSTYHRSKLCSYPTVNTKTVDSCGCSFQEKDVL